MNFTIILDEANEPQHLATSQQPPITVKPY